MRRAILFVVSCACAFGQMRIPGPGGAKPSAGGGTFAHYYAITLGTITGTLTNFPLCVNTATGSFTPGCVTSADLSTNLNSAIVNTVTQTNNGYSVTEPADAVWTVTAPGGSSGAFTCPSGNYIPWETEKYSAGSWLVWVSIPSAATGTVVYVCFGQSGMTTQQNTGSVGPQNVWPSQYKTVFHFPNGSSLNISDSTSAANNGTLVATPTATAGEVDGGFNVVAASSQGISFPNPVSTGTVLTMSGWAKASTTAVYQFVVDNRGFVPGNTGCFLDMHITTGAVNWSCNGTNSVDGSTNLADGSFHYLVGTITGNSMVVYVDGSSVASAAAGTNISFAALTAHTGMSDDSVPGFATGSFDEVRLWNTVEGSAQVAVEFANQKASSSFLTAGSLQ